MKKIKILFAVLLALFTYGCTSASKLPEASEKMIELGSAALNIVDDYLDGKITGADAKKKLDMNYSSVKYQYEKDLEKLGTDTFTGTEYADEHIIDLKIYFIKSEIENKEKGIGTDKDIISKRNDLADTLGEEKR